MSVNLGGFGFDVSANVGPAQQAIERLRQQARVVGQQIEAALSGQIRPDIRTAEQAYQRLATVAKQATAGTSTLAPKVDTAQAEQGFARIERAARQVREQTAAITVRADVTEAQARLDGLISRARAAGSARITLTANVSGVKQAEQAVEQLSAALKGARAGERITLNIRAESVEQADNAVKRLTADIIAARAAGARVAVNVQTNAGGAGFLQQARGGFIQQVTPGLATGGAAAVGVVAAQELQKITGAFKDALAAGISYNAMLETSAAQFQVFIGSAAGAEQALARLRRNADITPFDTAEVVKSGAVFAQVAGGSIERMERLLSLAEQLAAVNPNPALGGGLGGATFALREGLSGDFTSLRERFNVPREAIERVKALGLAGDDLAEALVRAAGGSQKLVDALSNTFEGRLSTARSHLADLGAQATKPVFDAISDGLKRFNDVFDTSAPRLRQLAAFGPAIALAFVPGGQLPALAVGVNAATRSQQPQAPAAPTEAERNREAQAQAQNRAVDAQNTALTAQQRIVEQLKEDQARIERAARKVTQEYENQLRPLVAQQRALQEQQRGLDARRVDLGNQRAAAGPPVEVRAQAAADQTILDHERELTEIRHRRAELAESLARAEEAAANRVAEAQIRGQERALAALQQRVQAEQQARQDVLDGLREEIAARQEARQAALDGLRDQIAAQQEQRRDALDGIREEIRSRREAVDLAREAAQEASRAAQEAFQDYERLAERGHQSLMQNYQDQIQALRDQLDVRREQSEAERALVALDRAERERGRQERIADARRAVARATTLRGRQDAQRNLNRAEHEVAVDRQREQIQDRINKEKEAAEKRREAIQAKIAEVERQQRADDRKFQELKERREDAFRVQQRQQQEADRAADKAERETRRTEDAKVRALEKADREQTKVEQAIIRAQERADRAQDKAEQAQIRAAEKQDRDLDRQAQREILTLQQQIVTARNALADRKEAVDIVLDAAGLGRLREQVDLENRQLEIRQKLELATDPSKLASVASAQVFLDEAQRILDGKKTLIEGTINAIKTKEETEIGGLRSALDDLEIKIKAAQQAIEALKKAPIIVDTRQFDEGPHEATPGGAAAPADLGPFAGLVTQAKQAVAAIGDLGTKSGAAIGEGIANWLKDDTTVQAAIGDWVSKSILDNVGMLLGIHSPSAVAAGWAASLAEGFINEITAQRQAIAEAIEAPFVDVTDRYFPAALPKFKAFGQDAAEAVDDGWDAEHLDIKIRLRIQEILDAIARSRALFRTAGQHAGQQFSDGFCHALSLIDCFKTQMEWMVRNAKTYGSNVGVNFSAGFTQTANVGGGAATGGTTGGSPNPTNGDYRPADPSARSCQPGWTFQVINGVGWCIRNQAASGGTGALRPIARAAGGPIWPNQDFLLGEDGPEIVRFRRAGSVLPAAMTARALAGAGTGSSPSAFMGGGMGAPVINVTVNVSGTGLNVERLSQAIKRDTTDAVASALLEHAQNYPRRVSKTLPGAR